MTDLQRRSLRYVPLTKETVQSFYDGTHSGTEKECLRALCESHERLRAELEGAEILLADHSRAGAMAESCDSEHTENRSHPLVQSGGDSAPHPEAAGRGGSIPPTGEYMLVEQCEHGRPYDLHIVHARSKEIVGRYLKSSRKSAERHLREWNEGKRA